MTSLGAALIATALTACSPDPADIAQATQQRIEALQALRDPKSGFTPVLWCNTVFVSKAPGFKNPLKIMSVPSIVISPITWSASFVPVTKWATAVAPTDPATQTIRYEHYPHGVADGQYSPLSPDTMKCHPDSDTK